MADWNPRANELFLHAAELRDSAQREAYLKEHCRDDALLRSQVESLLVASVKAASFLEGTGELHTAKVLAHTTGSDATGTVVGPYKLLQKIGEGGMGSVWVAEQEQPVKRRVALKLIRTGMDSVTFLRRFEAERQALALMDHSHIAKVLDAGSTTDGRPYFVMELIKGVPITKYCDELHLTLRQRLELFIPVCQAIQHAHQKGIIHRDIKPSNILVAMQDGQPVPKIIDFGVAKALHQPLTEGTLMTEFGAVVGTLEYMSPEQAELSALDVDTRADVYALGVLLYELLTGSTPLDKDRLKSAAFVELLRVIKEEEPPKPSTRLTQSRENLGSLAALRRTEPAKLQKEVSGELDLIVMHCLEKDRTRRYESASALAQDVQRHLANEPVLACPPSAGYRFKKWAGRNKVVIVATVIIWLLTINAFGFALIQWLNTKRAEERAVVERDQANEARRLSNEAVVAKTAALRRSEARRLVTTALMKASTDPDITGPLVQEALALENDTVVTSSALAALSNLPRMTAFEKTTPPQQQPSFTPCYWYTFAPDGKHLIVPCDFGEWIALFDATTGKLVRTFLTHHEGVTNKRILVSPDGAWLISLCGRHLYVWEISTGKLMSDFRTEKEFYAYSTAVISSDGKTLAAIAQESGDDASRKGARPREFQIWLWNLPTGQGRMIFSTREHTPFRLAFSPDGRHLAAAQQGKSQVWLFDVSVGKLCWTKEKKDQGISDPVIVFSHDSQRVIELEKHQLCIRRCVDGETEKEEDLGENFAYTGASSHVSADHRMLVLNPYVEDITIGSSRTTYSQQPIRVYDLKEMRWQFQIPQAADPCPRLRISANGERIVTFSSNQVVELWENGRSLSRTQIPGSRIQFLAMNPDGHSVVIQRQDNSLMRIDLDQDGFLPRREQALGDWMLSDDGLTLYLSGYYGNPYLETLDAATLKTLERRQLAKPNGPAMGPAQMRLLSHGSRVLCTFSNGEAVLLDSANSARVATFQKFPNGFYRPNNKLAMPHFGGSLYLVGFSKNEPAQRFGQSDHDLFLYDSRTGNEIMRLAPGFPVSGFRDVDFSRNGRWLALLPAWLGGDTAPPREIQLWDTREKRLIEHIPYASDFIPDGIALRADGQQLVAWEQRGQLACWDQQTKSWRTLSTKTSINRAALSADGKYLATCGGGNLTLRDMTRNQSVYSISLNPNDTWDVQFSAGDTMVLTVSHNKIHLWPIDLVGYLNKQTISKLTPSQKHELGIIP